MNYSFPDLLGCVFERKASVTIGESSFSVGTYVPLKSEVHISRALRYDVTEETADDFLERDVIEMQVLVPIVRTMHVNAVDVTLNHVFLKLQHEMMSGLRWTECGLRSSKNSPDAGDQEIGRAHV